MPTSRWAALAGGALALLVEPPFHDPGPAGAALLVAVGAVAGAVAWRSHRRASAEDLGEGEPRDAQAGRGRD